MTPINFSMTNQLPTSIKENLVQAVPKSIIMYNYPNPFNPSTTIAFQLPAGTRHALTLQIYDISGKLIKTLIDEKMEAGYHSVVWHGRDSMGKDVPSGVYFYKIESGSYSMTKSMLLLK